MMKSALMSFVGAVASLCLGATAAQATVYSVSLYEVDDQAYAFISNSAFAGTQVAQSNFSFVGTGDVDITQYVRTGTNTITIDVYNGPAGWKIGWNFKIDGIVADSFDCGIWNTYGCNADEYKVGLVYSHAITFDVPSSSPATVPEPESWALMLAGFSVVGSILRSKHKRSGLRLT